VVQVNGESVPEVLVLARIAGMQQDQHACQKQDRASLPHKHKDFFSRFYNERNIIDRFSVS
jgi:hypothetical protein